MHEGEEDVMERGTEVRWRAIYGAGGKHRVCVSKGGVRREGNRGVGR